MPIGLADQPALALGEGQHAAAVAAEAALHIRGLEDESAGL